MSNCAQPGLLLGSPGIWLGPASGPRSDPPLPSPARAQERLRCHASASVNYTPRPKEISEAWSAAVPQGSSFFARPQISFSIRFRTPRQAQCLLTLSRGNYAEAADGSVVTGRARPTSSPQLASRAPDPARELVDMVREFPDPSSLPVRNKCLFAVSGLGLFRPGPGFASSCWAVSRSPDLSPTLARS